MTMTLLCHVCRGRLGKGRFFIFHNADGQAVHFVPPELMDQGNVMVNSEEPLKCSDQYLQVMATTDPCNDHAVIGSILH